MQNDERFAWEGKRGQSMKKKVLATLLSVTMIASVLVGCGGDDAASSSSGSEAGQTTADTTESSTQKADTTETTEASDSAGGVKRVS